MPEPRPPRFLTIDQVAEELNISKVQATALVKRGDIAGVKIGGRGLWRVERVKIEEYITRLYEEFDRAHNLPAADTDEDPDA